LPIKRKHVPAIHGERRIGLPNRRVTQSEPIEQPLGSGWRVGPNPVYKRTAPFTGEVTYSPDGRIGPKDRRQKK